MITEYKRKAFHILYGTIVSLLVYLGWLDFRILISILVIGILLSVVTQRWNVPVISWFLDVFERSEDKKNFPGRGAIYYTAGMSFALLLFPKLTAIAGIMILAWGDSISACIGRKVRNPKFKNKKGKTVEGLIAGTVAGAIAGAWFVGPFLSFVGSIVAMAFEFGEVRLGKVLINDNLTIPLISGATIELVKFALSYLI